MLEKFKFINRKIISIILVLFIILYSVMGLFEISNAAKTYNQYVKSGISAFPEDYQVYLKKIQQEHPNWTFDAY